MIVWSSWIGQFSYECIRHFCKNRKFWKVKKWTAWFTKDLIFGIYSNSYTLYENEHTKRTPYLTNIRLIDWRKFDLVTKILSEAKFCLRNFKSNISIHRSGKDQTKFTKTRLSEENFVRRISFTTNLYLHLSRYMLMTDSVSDLHMI